MLYGHKGQIYYIEQGRSNLSTAYLLACSLLKLNIIILTDLTTRARMVNEINTLTNKPQLTCRRYKRNLNLGSDNRILIIDRNGTQITE